MRLKCLTRLRLGLSHLNEHRFITIFKVELTFYVFVALKLNQLHIFTALPSFLKYLFKSHIKQYKWSFGQYYQFDDYILVKIFLFGYQNYTQVENSYIIYATIKYLVDSERFYAPLQLYMT